MDEAERRLALADFLRTRRARLRPADVGLRGGARRRTPGLRREEVAFLANIGTAWYTALEQGRDVRPSVGVLESLTRALRLRPDEREYLFLLANQPIPAEPPPDEEIVSLAVRRFIDDLVVAPAYVLGRRWDYLYWNRAAEALFGFGEAQTSPRRNALWRIFMDSTLRRQGWEEVARTMLAQFRADSARYPGDPRFAELIDELERLSPEFRAWWPRHDVRATVVECRKELTHPLVGCLVLMRTTLRLAMAPDLRVMVYTPMPEADTAAKIRQLVEQPIGAAIIQAVGLPHFSVTGS